MRSSRVSLLLSLFAGLPMLGLSLPIHAANCTPQASWAGTVGGLSLASIRLTSSTVGSTVLSGAAGMWNNGCNSASTLDIPQILTSGTGSATINVVLHSGSTNTTLCPGASGCGCANLIWPNGSGGVTNGTIHLFETASNGVNCAPIRSETIAHEIGHNLGLDDVASACYSMCAGRIMGQPQSQPSRSVGTAECGATDQIWTVPNENNGGGQEGGGGCLTFQGKEL